MTKWDRHNKKKPPIKGGSSRKGGRDGSDHHCRKKGDKVGVIRGGNKTKVMAKPLIAKTCLAAWEEKSKPLIAKPLQYGRGVTGALLVLAASWVRHGVKGLRGARVKFRTKSEKEGGKPECARVGANGLRGFNEYPGAFGVTVQTEAPKSIRHG